MTISRIPPACCDFSQIEDVADDEVDLPLDAGDLLLRCLHRLVPWATTFGPVSAVERMK